MQSSKPCLLFRGARSEVRGRYSGTPHDAPARQEPPVVTQATGATSTATPLAVLQARADSFRRTARKVLPGLALAAVVGLGAHIIAERAFPYALAVGLEVPLALLAGLILVNLGLAPPWASPGIQFASQRVLRLGIILLGLRLNLDRSWSSASARSGWCWWAWPPHSPSRCSLASAWGCRAACRC